MTSSETVYAKVIGCPGYSDSAVGSAAYTTTSTGPGLPTLVQDSAWGTNDGTETGNGFIYHLPNPTLANNLLICGVSWDTAATATITDNIGTNTWVSGPTSNNGTRRVALRYVLGVAAGTQDLTLTLSASAANVHFRCSEFYNVATAPGSGIRIVHLLTVNNDASSADFTFQWPCSGNLTVFTQGESNAYHTITSITDSNSNTFNLVSHTSGEPWMFYAANMNCSSPNTRTMVVRGNVGGSSGSDVIYDIANAAASPYDTRSAAGQIDSQGTAGTSSCVLNSAATDHAPDITPTVAPGIAIVVAEEGTGPRCALVGTGYVADMAWYTGATDNSTLMDNGNGYGHYYYSNTSTIDFHWLWANGTKSDGYHVAATFKQASGSSPATPTFSPVAGTYTSSQSVTISTATTACSSFLYWNTNGNPTLGDTHGTSVNVAASETVFAKVIGCPGFADSAVGSAAYTINSSLPAATPAFSPAAGTYNSTQAVTISTSSPGCSAYHYWNTTGAPTSGDTHGTSVSVAASETVYAKVIGCPGYYDSAVGSAAYTINSLSQAASPAFSPAAGSYTGTQGVTISTSTPGCSGSLYWNTTGNPTSGDTHGTSVSVAASETVYAKVIGCPGYTDSTVGSAAYTINSSSQAATPAFSPGAGAYSSAQSVTISTSAPGCSAYIYWNKTGNPTSGDTNGNSVNVASDQTVYAKVIGCPGYSDSTVGSAAYTITLTSGLPTLVQDSAWGTNNGTENGNGFTYHLPNPSLGGSSTQGDSSNNLIVVAFSWAGTATLTSLSDNNGNTWTTGASCNDSGSPRRNIRILYAMGAKPGTQDLMLTFSTAVGEVHLRASEFYNVSVSSAVDGTPSCTASTSNFGPFIAAGSITTTVDNDLIYHYGIDNTALCCTNRVTSFAVGTDFSLLPSDRHLGHFAQWQVQSIHGSINPTMTVNQSSNDAFDSGAIALKAASAGTAPSPGIRIVREYHTSIDSTAYVVQWPCSGNLTVVAQGENNTDHLISSVADSDSSTFIKVTPPSPVNGFPQVFYAANHKCTNPNTRMMTLNNAAGGATGVPVIYDITGANSSPYDKVAGAYYPTQGAAGGHSCPGAAGSDTDHAPDLTPNAGPGLAIAVLNNGTGPTCAVRGAGYVHDSAWYTGDSDQSTLLDSANGFAHKYYSDTSTLDFHWDSANSSATNGFALAVSFKQ